MQIVFVNLFSIKIDLLPCPLVISEASTMLGGNILMLTWLFSQFSNFTWSILEYFVSNESLRSEVCSEFSFITTVENAIFPLFSLTCFHELLTLEILSNLFVVTLVKVMEIHIKSLTAINFEKRGFWWHWKWVEEIFIKSTTPVFLGSRRFYLLIWCNWM